MNDPLGILSHHFSGAILDPGVQLRGAVSCDPGAVPRANMSERHPIQYGTWSSAVLPSHVGQKLPTSHLLDKLFFSHACDLELEGLLEHEVGDKVCPK